MSTNESEKSKTTTKGDTGVWRLLVREKVKKHRFGKSLGDTDDPTATCKPPQGKEQDTEWLKFKAKLDKSKTTFGMFEKLRMDEKLRYTASTLRNVAMVSAEQGDFTTASSKLDDAVQEALTAMKDAVDRCREHWKKVEPAIKNAERGYKAKAYGDPPPKVLKTEFDELASKTVEFHKHYDQEYPDFVEAERTLNEIDTIVGRIRTTVDRLAKDIGGSAKSDGAKALVMAALETVYNVELQREVRCECGKLKGEENLGKKCDSCEEKVYPPAWSKKALPRLYKVLGSVPPSHTVNNERLMKIDRHRDSGEGASWYNSDENVAVLNLDRTGKFRGMLNIDIYKIGERKILPGFENKIVSEFDVTTLHEVGHSVDAKMKFMENRMENAAYGNWRKETIPGIAGKVAEEKGFYDDFKIYPRNMLLKYLIEILSNNDDPSTKLEKDWKKAATEARAAKKMAPSLSTDPGLLYAESIRTGGTLGGLGVKSKTKNEAMIKTTLDLRSDPAMATVFTRVVVALIDDNKPIDEAIKDTLKVHVVDGDSPDAPDWKALSKHAAVSWCKDARSNKDNGLWDGGDSAAKKHVLKDGRVYQQAYSAKWFSYDISARTKRVNNYQFRAEGEWFAEIYAIYYMREMKESHPDYKWFKEEVDF